MKAPKKNGRDKYKIPETNPVLTLARKDHQDKEKHHGTQTIILQAPMILLSGELYTVKV
jgi:hypothetical protein